MAYKIITNDFRVNEAQQFLESFSEDGKTFYYLFFGRHIPYSGGVVPEVESSRQDLSIAAYADMMFAKRITEEDTTLSILRVDWQPNLVYSEYDHRVENDDPSQFYVGVQEGDNYNVFRCLFNNGGVPSTVAPSFTAFSLVESADTETYDGYYETSDGYQWKYMFTVGSDEMTKFATSRYVPLMANSSVTEFAIPGAIDVIKVESGGAGYDNHFSSEFSANSDIAYLGNSTYFAIRTNQTASPSSVDDFYNGCIFKITDGRGIGQFREITDYVNSGNARYVILDEPFSIVPDTTSKFEITPKVTVRGRNVSPAVGRALIGQGNSVTRVEILDRGSGYSLADAAILQSNTAVESNTAVLVPIIPPPGGHGSHPESELGARWFTLSVTIDGDENGAIPEGQKFGQVGILKDPLFSNVEVTTVKMSNTSEPGRDGGFIEGETVVSFSPILQSGTFSVTSGNNVVGVVDTDLCDPRTLQFPQGRIFLYNTEDPEWFCAEVSSANSTAIVMADQATFTTNLAQVFISPSRHKAKHLSSGLSYSYLGDVEPGFAVGDKIFGLQTFSTAVITQMENNNRPLDGLGVVNQLSVISITDPVSTFSEDDFLSDVDGLNTCYFHSYANANHLYVTRVMGAMEPGTLLRNVGTTASAVVADKYDGQIVQESGSVIYLENHEPVSRETSTSQTKKIIVEF